MKCPADGATPVRQISWLSQIYAPTSSADGYFVGAPLPSLLPHLPGAVLGHPGNHGFIE